MSLAGLTAFSCRRSGENMCRGNVGDLKGSGNMWLYIARGGSSQNWQQSELVTVPGVPIAFLERGAASKGHEPSKHCRLPLQSCAFLQLQKTVMQRPSWHMTICRATRCAQVAMDADCCLIITSADM